MRIEQEETYRLEEEIARGEIRARLLRERGLDEPLRHGTPATPADQDFSIREKAIGVYAATRSPISAAISAHALLNETTDPAQRRSLERQRNLSLVLIAVGVVIAMLVIAFSLSIYNRAGTFQSEINDLTVQTAP